jgi:hypothetical protein
MKTIVSRSPRKIVKDCKSWNKFSEGKYCWEWRGLIVSKNRSLSSYLSTGSRNHKSAGKKLEIQMLICEPQKKQDLSTRKAPRTIWVITLERKKLSTNQLIANQCTSILKSNKSMQSTWKKQKYRRREIETETLTHGKRIRKMKPGGKGEANNNDPSRERERERERERFTPKII